MRIGTRIFNDRLGTALLAAATALALWWSVSNARPQAQVLNPHEGIECAGCHMQVPGGPGGGAGTGTDANVGTSGPAGATHAAADRKCAQCHSRLDRGSELAAVFHGTQGEACSSCHSFHSPSDLKAQNSTFLYEYGNPKLRTMCGSCHLEGGRLSKLTEGHRDAATAYHVDSGKLADLTPSESCLRCHSQNGSDPTMPASAATAPRFHEEATHPLGATVSLGMMTGGYSIRRTLDPRIVLFNDRIECQSCHAVADDVEDLLVRFETKYDLCLGCHERHPSAAGTSLASALPDPLQ